MKSNKEKIYDFIQMHDTAEKEGGVSTTYIAQALSLQRTNVSSLLNALVEEGRIHKSNGRPVLYRQKHLLQCWYYLHQLLITFMFLLKELI